MSGLSKMIADFFVRENVIENIGTTIFMIYQTVELRFQ